MRALILRWRAWQRVLLTGLLVMSWAARGHADASERVVLFLPPQADANARELAARMRGELGAAGFEVTAERAAPSSAPSGALERAAMQRDEAILLLLGGGEQPSLDVWIAERVRGQLAHAHMSVERSEPDAARRLAVQVVEHLRSHSAERTSAAPEPVPAARPAQQPAEEAVIRHLSWVPGAGLFVLFRPHLWERSPMASVSLAVLAAPERVTMRHPAFGVALTLSGFGPTITRHTQDGAADARQGLALCEAQLVGQLSPWLKPDLGLGLGVYAVRVEGRSSAPFEAHESTQYAALSSARVGLELPLFSVFSLRLSGYVMHASSKTAVLIREQQVARTGGLLSGLGLEVRAWL